MDGYAGNILYVDLSTGSLESKPFSEELKRQYIGGRGLGVKIFTDSVDPLVDPMSAENLLIFATGPLTGTGTYLGSRYDVITKSPLNDTLTSANSGGFFGKELKRAGFDAVVISGISDEPAYLWIDNGVVEIRDACPYWGCKVSDTVEDIKHSLSSPGIEVLCIGPAGERLSRISSIINETFRSAGRGGVGAVMGSKRLKAIAVRGEKKTRIADPVRLKELKRAEKAKITNNPVTGEGLPAYGTAVLVNIINENYIMPTRNFQSGHFPEAEKVSGELLAEKYLKRKKGCHSCIVACGRETLLEGEKGDGPEYETLWAFGPNLDCADLPTIIRANNLCNELGIDTMSAGVTIACAMELAEKGYLKEDIRFGNCGIIPELVKMMGYREGIGDEMADGSYAFGERYGHPEFSMTVKKQELAAYDPRGLQGHGLAYATSVRGGDHVYAYLISPEVLGLPEKIDPYLNEGKAEWVKTYQDLTAVIDSSGMCLFSSFAIGAGDYADLLSAVTGWDIDAEEVLQMGERIWNLQKLFIMKNGYTKEDDTLPLRLLEEPLREGAPSGRVWEREPLLQEYYALRGWDEEGRPRPEKLRELGILSP